MNLFVLIGIVVVIGLIVFAVVRVRNKREAVEAERLNQTAARGERSQHEHHDRPSGGHHHR